MKSVSTAVDLMDLTMNLSERALALGSSLIISTIKLSSRLTFIFSMIYLIPAASAVPLSLVVIFT